MHAGDQRTDMSRLAVVGTDTGVGKTVVTAGLVGRLREAGVDAVAVKPCQTGHPPDDDAGFVREACGTEAAAVCGDYLEPALAPEVAAERTGTDLSYREIREFCAEALADAEACSRGSVASECRWPRGSRWSTWSPTSASRRWSSPGRVWGRSITPP
jgi:hypothetical protein